MEIILLLVVIYLLLKEPKRSDHPSQLSQLRRIQEFERSRFIQAQKGKDYFS